MIKKINLENIVENPYDNFYKNIIDDLDIAIDEYIKSEMSDNNFDLARQERLSTKIKSNLEEIKNFKRKNKINLKKTQNFLIKIGFFLLVGFFFFKKYKLNKSIIKEFKQLTNNLINENEDAKERIILTNKKSFSSINIFVFLSQYFNQKGIEKLTTLRDFEIKKTLTNYKKNLGQKTEIVELKGVQFEIRTNTVYDVLSRELSFRYVSWTRSETYPYSAIETYVNSNGSLSTRTVTRYETLTALHEELTPFIDEENSIIYKTNFDKKLSFKTKGSSNTKSINFENKDFSKSYKIWDANDRIALNSFFTIFAQENYYKWFTISKDFYYFEKFLDNIMIYPYLPKNRYNLDNQHYFLKMLNINKNSSDYLLSNKELTTFNQMYDFIKQQIGNYINKIADATILPLCSPVIAREYYRKNKNYMILNNYKNFNEEQKNEERTDYFPHVNIIINKFGDNLFFNFLKHDPKKPIWLESKESWVVDFDTKLMKFKLDLKSFRVEHLLEYVTVVGTNVGTKTIQVDYDRFFPINEIKDSFYLPIKKEIENYILINNKLDINKIYFEDDESKNYLKLNKIWSNNPTKITSESELENLKIINDNFKNLTSISNIDASLSIDNEGIYILCNQEVPKNVEENIKSFMLKIKNIYE